MKHYVTEHDGGFELRQPRFYGRMKEHPHDLNAWRESLDEIKELLMKFWHLSKEEVDSIEIKEMPKGFKRIDQTI